MRWSRGLWYPSIGNQRRMSLSLSCRVTTHKEDGGIIEDGGRRESGGYGGDISKNVLKPRYPYRPESIWCVCPSLSSAS
jgi:hypothetical protein